MIEKKGSPDAPWEGYGRSALRIIAAFTFSLHGFRLALGVLPTLAGRRGAMLMALDLLPRAVGYWEIFAGGLLFLGLFARPVAFISFAVAIAAYLYGAVPRGVWPIRNGGNETLLYAVIFLNLAIRGSGHWAVDRFVASWRGSKNGEARPVVATRS